MGIEHNLTHHRVSQVGVNDIEMLREKAKRLGVAIEHRCPIGRERALAITKLEEAIMWAVKAIALGGVEEPAKTR